MTGKRKRENCSGTRLYRIWKQMRYHCQHPRKLKYKNSEEKPPKVCEEWDSSFLKFKEWADANGYAETLSCGRKDSTGDFCPENCRWVPRGTDVSRANLKPDSLTRKIVNVKFSDLEIRKKLIRICEAENKTMTKKLEEMIEEKYQKLFVT